MSYKNNISHLRAGLEESKRLYSEAVRKQLHTDVEIWADDIKHLKYQIIVHAKAEAFNEIYEEYKKEVKTLEELRQSKDMRKIVREVMEKYESGVE